MNIAICDDDIEDADSIISVLQKFFVYHECVFFE